jgi:uncharacterized membrane protein YhaH (DUF805 family)
MNWYSKVVKQYTDFYGRARRKEYWMFTLFNCMFFIVAMVLDNVLGLTIGNLPYGALYFLYAIFIFIPGLAVTVRRLHDIGKSGWMLLISLLPIVGAIWLLVLLLTNSQHEENEYGESPKLISDEELISDENSKDTILLVVIFWMIFSRLFWSLIPKFMDNVFLEGWFKLANTCVGIVWAFIPIVLSLTIKNKSKRLLLIILGIIYLISTLFEIVKALF